MNRKAQMSIGLIFMSFLGVMVGIALMGQVINDQYKLTHKLTVINDSLLYAAPVAEDSQINETYQMNVTKVLTDWRSSGCPLSGITVTNSSGTEYDVNTDYVLTTSRGNLTLKNTAKVNASVASDNLTYVSYSYCDPGYNKDASARSIASLFTLFMAMGIAALGYFVGKKAEWF